MTEHQLDRAVEFLKDGLPFKIGDIVFGLLENGVIYVTGWTKYSNIEFLAKSTAIDELSEIKEIFQRILSHSPQLAQFVRNRIIEYNLAWNYGMGAIGICFEREGKISWELDLQ